MSIFSKTKGSEVTDGHFLGLYVSPEMHELITLATLSKQISKTEFIKERLGEWYRPGLKEQFIAELVHHCVNAWAEEKSDLDEFTERLREDLIGRKLPAETVQAIIDKFQMHVQPD